MNLAAGRSDPTARACRRPNRGGVRQFLPSSTLDFLWLHGCLCSACWFIQEPGPSKWNLRVVHSNGRDRCAGRKPAEQAGILIQAMNECVQENCQGIAGRFVPFVTMHEFEGLLFSGPEAMAVGMGVPALARQFQDIRDLFHTPEHINDSSQTAPSKRIKDLMPKYEKVLQGNLAALSVTLPSIRDECEIFNDWVCRLESQIS